MSPVGFWTARAGVAYTANGAFVGWLLDQYGAAPLRAAYRTGRFDAAYGQSLEALTAAWGADLARRPVDPEAVAVARWLFSRPSLFEARCPHHVPEAVRLARDGVDAWERGDAVTADRAFRASADENPYALTALSGALQASLAVGEGVPPGALGRAEALADSLPTAATLAHLADVRRLLGRDAVPTYAAARDSLAPIDAVGRLLLDRRAALDAGTLREWLSTPPDSASAWLVQDAPVLAALRLSAADRPAEAWAVARSWCLPGLTVEQDSSAATEAGRVLRLLQGTMAYRAGALPASARTLDGLDAAFADAGPNSLAALVRDRAARVRWRQGLLDPPAIFVAPTPTPDALTPCSAVRRPAVRDGLRAP